MQALRWRRDAAWWARLGITVQFLALVRTLAEYFRLEHVDGAAFTAAVGEAYVVGGLIAAVLCWASVTLYFLRRHRAAALTSAATVLVLLVYRFAVMG